MGAFRISACFLMICLTAVSALAAERMSIKAEVANVRADPGTQGDILWKMERHYPLMVIEKKGPWFRFKDMDGHQGWIHKSLLGATPTVVVRVRLANIRSGPGTKHDVVFDAEKGTPFKVIEKKDRWIRIQHSDGDKGWVFESLVW